MLASEAFLRSAAEMWMCWMMAMSWQVSVLVAVVFVVSLVARKASARFRYALWCLVLLKLCLPPTFSFVTGIGRWLPAIGSERIESAAVSEMPAPIPAATLRPSDEVTTSPPLELPPASTGVLLPATLPPQQSARVYLSWPFVLFAVWLAGVLTFALILGRQYRKMRRYLLTARPVRDEETLRLIDEAKESLRLKTSIRFLESPDLFSPILLGLFRPHIIVPANTLKGAENRQILPVFLHELAHLKRRDLWVNWVQAILQILYWFHPLAWIANLYIRREREMIVDDMVLVHLKGEREAYGDSLVSILKQAAQKKLLAPGYLGIVETKKSLAYRLRRILDANRKLSVRLGWMSAAMLIAFALILIPQAGAQKTEPELPEGAQGVEAMEKDFSSSTEVAEAKQVERPPEWVVLDSPIAGSKYALQFDGLTDFVEVPDSPSLDLTNSLTLEAWINFDVGGDNNPRIISKGWEVRTGYELAVYGTGEKRRLAFLAKGIGRTYSNTILRAHTWYHVAATYNGTEVTLYVNGKQDILRNVTGGDVPFNIPTNNVNLNIGRNSQTFNDRYKGLIKEVRIWNAARTEPEIRRDMSRVLTGTEAHLAAYWKLDEGKGLTVHDISPHKNHGYLGGKAAQEPPRVREAKEEVQFDLLTPMVSVGRCVMKQEADYVTLTPSTPDRSYMRTKEAFCPPFALQIRGMTDSTNLRLYYASGIVIFNWELKPAELRIHDPLTGRVTAVPGQGYISPNRWHDITWEIEPDGMRVLVDGEERFRRTGDYSKIEEPVGIGPAFGSKLSVQSFVIRRGVSIEQVSGPAKPVPTPEENDRLDSRDYLVGWFKMTESDTMIPVFKTDGTYYSVCRGFEIPFKESPEGLEWAPTQSSMVGTTIGFDEASSAYYIAVRDSQLDHFSDGRGGIGEKQPMTRMDKPSWLLDPTARRPSTNDDFLGWYQPIWLPCLRWEIRKDGERYLIAYQERREPGLWKPQGEPDELAPLPDRLGFTGFDRRNRHSLTYNEALKRFELTKTTSPVTTSPVIRMPLAQVPPPASPEGDTVPLPPMEIGIPSWH